MTRQENSPEIQTQSAAQEPNSIIFSGARFSSEREVRAPAFPLPKGLKFDKRNNMDGLRFLGKIGDDVTPVVFFDPQYNGVLKKLDYGKAGNARGRRRLALEQMSEDLIQKFVAEIDRVLIPTGHLFLWVDKFHLCEGVLPWVENTKLVLVDMVIWHKGKMGMGYRTRRSAEYCVVFQKKPTRASGVWTSHKIPDVIEEKVMNDEHPHTKPVDMQSDLLEAVSNVGDVIVDPAAGSYSVMKAANSKGRRFLGCDLVNSKSFAPAASKSAKSAASKSTRPDGAKSGNAAGAKPARPSLAKSVRHALAKSVRLVLAKPAKPAGAKSSKPAGTKSSKATRSR